MRKTWFSGKAWWRRALRSRAARSVPKGFSMMMRARSASPAAAEQGDGGERGRRRHAQVVQPPAFAVEAALGAPDRRTAAPRRRRPAARSRGCRRRRTSRPPRSLRVPNSSSALRTFCLNPSASRSSSDTPTMRQPGMKPALARWNSPGSSLRRARSPVAPNSTTTCGNRGPTPAGILATVFVLRSVGPSRRRGIGRPCVRQQGDQAASKSRACGARHSRPCGPTGAGRRGEKATSRTPATGRRRP